MKSKDSLADRMDSPIRFAPPVIVSRAFGAEIERSYVIAERIPPNVDGLG